VEIRARDIGQYLIIFNLSPIFSPVVENVKRKKRNIYTATGGGET
jgi:hypothetical protein